MNQNDSPKKNHASGPGGAHLHIGMFGVRGPLLAPEDGAGGGTAATTTTTTAAGDGGTTAATPPPAASTPKVFTQEEVNKIAAQAREDGRKAAASAARPQQSTTSSTTTTTAAAPAPSEPTVQSIAAQLEDERMRREFAEFAADYNVPRSHREDLFDLFKTQRPGDKEAWFAKKQEQFGFKPQAAGSTATTSTTAASTTTAATAASGAASQTTPDTATPRAAAPSAPAGNSLPTQNGIVDIFALAQNDRAALNAMGPEGVKVVLEKLWAIGNQLNGAPARPKVPSSR